MSRAECQRLGLARTLVHDPSVLLLEESAAALDAGGVVELTELIGDLQAMGKTILVSSDRVGDLEGMVTHLGVMAGGRMVDSGRVAEVAAAKVR